MKRLLASKLVIIIAILAITVCCNTSGKKAEKTMFDMKVSSVEVSITGMSCTDCEKTIQKSVSELDGIISVKALFTEGKAFIEYSPSLTDTIKIRNAITRVGYVVKGFLPMPPSDSMK